MLFILFDLWVLPGMGFLAQLSLFGYSWIQCFLGRKLPKGPLGVYGIRYSVMRICGVDWLCCGSGLLSGGVSATWVWWSPRAVLWEGVWVTHVG